MANYQDRLTLPWTVESKENRQFKTILVVMVLVMFGVSIWIPTITLPEPDRETLEKLPPQLAKLIVKKEKPKPIKKVEPPKEEPKKKEEPKPEPKKEPKKEPKPKKVEPKPKPKIKQTVKQARDVAKSAGLLALQDDFADLRDTVDMSALKKKPKPTKTQAKAEVATAKSKSKDEIVKSSQGIITKDLARTSEAVALAARKATELEETEDEKALALAEAEAALKSNERSDQSIKLTLERLKKPLEKLYTREARNDPFLEGTVRIEITVEPSGAVSNVRIVSSELNHKSLLAKFKIKIMNANFGAEDVARITFVAPFAFGIE